MKILVITLGDGPRFRVLASELERLGLRYEQIAAVDGRVAGYADTIKPCVTKASRATYGVPLTATEHACALSHKLAQQRALEMGSHWTCILEDDAVLAPEFPRVLQAIEDFEVTEPTIVSLFSPWRALGRGLPRSLSWGQMHKSFALQRLIAPAPFAVAYCVNRQALNLAEADTTFAAFRADWPVWATLTHFEVVWPNPIWHDDSSSTMKRGDEMMPIDRSLRRWLAMIIGVYLWGQGSFGPRAYLGYLRMQVAVPLLSRLARHAPQRNLGFTKLMRGG